MATVGSTDFERDDDGRINDRIVVRDSDGGRQFDVSVLAGDDQNDSVSVMVHVNGLSVALLISPHEATLWGQLLIAAGADTLSRRAGRRAG